MQTTEQRRKSCGRPRREVEKLIIVYILAIIGGLSVIGVVALVFLILINIADDRDIDPIQRFCSRTLSPCIYQDTTDQDLCQDCPIRKQIEEDEAEKGAQ